MSYKNKEWLYHERVEQHRTFTDIAKDFNVDRKSIEYYAKKFGIPKPPTYREIYVELMCHYCGDTLSKNLTYLVDRIRQGQGSFFCGKKCADAHHSEVMKGENNPNFNGEFHGIHANDILTYEERQANGRRAIEKLKETGEYEGRMRKLQEGHNRFFSTDEGKKLRQANGVKAYLTCAKNKTRRTSIEIKMAEELERRGIEYIEQYNLGDKFVLDFLLPDFNIVIECDGDYWHRLPKAVARDKSKNAYIKACGYSLYRFWESEINNDIEACVDVVLAEINAKEAI